MPIEAPPVKIAPDMSKISWNNDVWPLKISFCIQIILGDEYSPLAGVQFFFLNYFRRWPPKRIMWSDAFFALAATFRIPPFPTVSRFFRVGQRVAMWLDGLDVANPEEMDQSSKAWLDAISCLGWLGWLFPNSMHCTRFRKQSHLGASGENAKRSRRLHRDKRQKGSWFEH